MYQKIGDTINKGDVISILEAAKQKSLKRREEHPPQKPADVIPIYKMRMGQSTFCRGM